MHYLSLLLIKLGLTLFELSLFDNQVAAQVLRILKLLAKFDLSLVHLLAEILATNFNLLELDFELLGLLDRLLLFFSDHVLDPLLVLHGSLYLHLYINGAVADLTICMACAGLLLVNVLVDLFLLLLVLIAGFLLALLELGLLRLNLALPLIELQTLLLEYPSALAKILLFLQDV